MKIKLMIPVLFFAIMTQCSLSDRLGLVSDKIADAKLDIKEGKLDAQRRCNGGYCRDKCKSCKAKCTKA